MLGDRHSKCPQGNKAPREGEKHKRSRWVPACGEQTASPAWWIGEKWLFCVRGNPTLPQEKDVAARTRDQGLVILKARAMMT